jgi:hypothetical protein
VLLALQAVAQRGKQVVLPLVGQGLELLNGHRVNGARRGQASGRGRRRCRRCRRGCGAVSGAVGGGLRGSGGLRRTLQRGSVRRRAPVVLEGWASCQRRMRPAAPPRLPPSRRALPPPPGGAAPAAGAKAGGRLRPRAASPQGALDASCCAGLAGGPPRTRARQPAPRQESPRQPAPPPPPLPSHTLHTKRAAPRAHGPTRLTLQPVLLMASRSYSATSPRQRSMSTSTSYR